MKIAPPGTEAGEYGWPGGISAEYSGMLWNERRTADEAVLLGRHHRNEAKEAQDGDR